MPLPYQRSLNSKMKVQNFSCTIVGLGSQISAGFWYSIWRDLVNHLTYYSAILANKTWDDWNGTVSLGVPWLSLQSSEVMFRLASPDHRSCSGLWYFLTSSEQRPACWACAPAGRVAEPDLSQRVRTCAFLSQVGKRKWARLILGVPHEWVWSQERPK